MDDLANGLKKRADQLFASPERTNNDAIWNELSEFLLNNQHSDTAFSQGSATLPLMSNPGSKRTKRVYDSTALQAVQDLASAFQGTLTNPATVWSKLRFQEDALNNDADATIWLEKANQVMHNKFNESNFNTELAKAYQSFVALANMAIFQESDDEGGFRFTCMHLSQVSWAENKDGMVDTVFYRFPLTAKQAFEKWGADNSFEILECLEKNPDKEFQFMHCIYPRKQSEVDVNDLGLAPGNKRPVASVYLDMSHNHIVKESGYYETPVLVARWSLMPGEKYGRGPGHLAIPDVRTLNKLKELSLDAVALQVYPPLLANQRDIYGQLDMRPKSISIVKDHTGITQFRSEARNDVMQISSEELRQSIRGIFYLDKLLLPPRTETGEMTAFEVSQRVEQMQRVLGPVLARLNSELLQPLVVRSFKLMLRNNELPELPKILQEEGVDIEIVFVNQLARAQQIQDVSTIQQWIQNLAGLAQLDPTVIDNINIDGVAKHTAKILGVPEIAIQNDQVVQQLREQRAQAQQQAQALESGVKVADINSKLGGNDGTGSG